MDFYVLRGPDGTDAGLIGIDPQFPVQVWEMGTSTRWTLRTGYIAGRVHGNPEQIEAIATSQEMTVTAPVSLPWNPEQVDRYPEAVQRILSTVDTLTASPPQPVPTLTEEEAQVDNAGPLLARIKVACDGLYELQRRGWGDPAALGRVIFDTDGALETLGRELEITPESDVMRTVKAACSTLFRGVEQLKDEGPDSPQAHDTLSEGIGTLERAAAMLS